MSVEPQREFWATRITRYLAWVSGALLLFGCAGLITLDVITRSIFRRTVIESFELSSYAFAAAVTLGMAFTVSSKANIRIDLVTARLPRAVRIGCDILGHLGIVVLALTLAWYAFATWDQSRALNAKSISTLQIPLVVPQGIWMAGLIWFALFACLIAWRAAWFLAKRDLAAVERLIGPVTLIEEIEQAGVETPASQSPSDAKTGSMP